MFFLCNFKKYIPRELLFRSFFPGGEIRFTGSGSSDWFDPNNWQTSKFSKIGLYSQQIPCQYDVVTFPQVSCYLYERSFRLSAISKVYFAMSSAVTGKDVQKTMYFITISG